MKNKKYMVIFFALTILPLIAAIAFYDLIPSTVSITEGISFETGRERVFILPIINILVGIVIFMLFSYVNDIINRRVEQGVQLPDQSLFFGRLLIYIISFFDVLCFCSIYGFYALDWGGTDTAALMWRGAAVMVGVGAIILAVILPTATKYSMISLRWIYTIKSDNVWYKTHKLSRPVFFGAGAFSIICGLLIDSLQPILISVIAVSMATLALYLYSRKLYFDEFM